MHRSKELLDRRAVQAEHREARCVERSELVDSGDAAIREESAGVLERVISQERV